MKNKILIYDDVPQTAAEWREELESVVGMTHAFSVEGLSNQDFVKEMQELQARRRRARNKSAKKNITETLLDATAILVVDYDLLRVEQAGYLTGETTAYLARCFSRCGLIVALNQYGANPFDLTLRGHPQSYADLNIGSEQLANTGLWNDSWTGFRPWAWPLLPKAHRALVKRQEELQTNLDSPIIEHLGISDEIARALPRAAQDFLSNRKSKTKTAFDKVTFRQFAEESGQGFKGKDRPLGDEDLARVAAARVAQWVESHLLPGQDILVDAPHLAYRYPSLLVGNRKKIDTWNRTARLSTKDGISLNRSALDQFSFRANWVSRPVWKWGGISKQESIKEVKEPWSIDRPKWVFCEDVSRFLPAAASQEFVAEVESPFATRYVVNPRSKKVGARLIAELERVIYTPLERLHL